VVLSREDVVRLGPKRPPIAAGLQSDGTGVLRIAAGGAEERQGVVGVIKSVAPGVEVDFVPTAGLQVSFRMRAAGWAEAAVLMAGAEAIRANRAVLGRTADGGATATANAPNGSSARAEVAVDGDGWPQSVAVEVSCGPTLDATVLRSYVTGAAHMALGWVLSEGIAVDESGVPTDLTIRSFGILRARDTPRVVVRLLEDTPDGPVEPVNGSDAVFAAVAAATWIAQGLPSRWPTRRGRKP
jgi:hypothetical protein